MSTSTTQSARTFPWISAGELRTSKADQTDPGEIFKKRFLCRGGGMLLVSPTGQGKSTLISQAAYLWACGRSAFGLTPSKAIKTFLVQAENDERDLEEMIQGVEKGFKTNHLGPEEIEQGDKNFRLITVSSETGDDFITKVKLMLMPRSGGGWLVVLPLKAGTTTQTNTPRRLVVFSVLDNSDNWTTEFIFHLH